MLDRSMVSIFVDMANYLNKLAEEPPMQNSTKYTIIDAKIKTAMVLGKDSTSEESWCKCVPESRPTHDIGFVVGAKQFRQWTKKMKNAFDQVRPNSRQTPDFVEKPSEDESQRLREQWDI